LDIDTDECSNLELTKSAGDLSRRCKGVTNATLDPSVGPINRTLPREVLVQGPPLQRLRKSERDRLGKGIQMSYLPDRNGRLSKILGHLIGGAALGLIPAAVYGGLVLGVHSAVTGHGRQALAFALECLLVGALLGLLVVAISALQSSAPRAESTRHRTAKF
jgi:hypothetical protein